MKRFASHYLLIPAVGYMKQQVVAVSYTHLDVYKRQEIYQGVGRPDSSDGILGGYEAPLYHV